MRRALMILFLLTAVARAEISFEWSLRQLAIEADAVVVVTPVEWPTTFRITRVLAGPRIAVGDELAVSGLSKEELASESVLGGRVVDPRALDEALLYLKGAPARWTLVHSGLRGRAGQVVARPVEVFSPGPFVLRPIEGRTWEETLRDAAEEVAAVGAVKRLRAIADARERSRALLAWIAEHGGEFGDGLLIASDEDDRGRAGWGSLELDTSEWVFESEVLEDCWRADVMHVARSPDDTPIASVHAYASPAGRTLLLQVAIDDVTSVPLRRRALARLAGSFWQPPRDPGSAVRQATPDEQRAAIAALIPLLRAADPGLRAGAARALASCSAPTDAHFRAQANPTALGPLELALATEPAGPAREALEEARDRIVEALPRRD